MNKIRCFYRALFSIILIIALTACQQKPEAANTLKVGVIAGPDEQVLEVAKKVAQQQYGLDLKIISFSDYTIPNAALNDGSIDANIFQHQPYLDAAIKANKYNLVAIGKTFIFPVGIYSKKYKNINQVPDNAVVAVPNDPSNETRALLLLAKAGLLTLKSNINADTNATIMDIATNPKHLKIKELDAAQLPRVLPDVALAVINTNYAIPAGLNPAKDAIFSESPDSPYANIIVVRAADKNEPKLLTLVKIMHSQAIVDAAKKIYAGQEVPAWQ